MNLILIDESEVLDWRKKGFKVHKRFKSGGVQMVEREMVKNRTSYVWTQEDKDELRYVLSTLKHLSYEQISEFYIPERTPRALQVMGCMIGASHQLVSRAAWDEINEKAYQAYMNDPHISLANIVRRYYPDEPYVNARSRLYRYICKKRNKTPIR